MNKGVCKFCGEEKELIKAHIIPKCFYKNYKKQGYKALYSDDGTWQQKQNGAYDNNILCSKCDNEILSSFEQEGKRVLLAGYKQCNTHKNSNSGTIYSLLKEDYNYDLLRKFFISIIWRASVSSEKEFKDINLGPYENKALEILRNEKEYNNLFKVFIFKIPDNSKLAQIVYIKKDKYCQTTMYDIVMHGYDIIMFVNYGKLPQNEKSLFDNILFSEKHLYILEMNDINNYNDMLKLLKNWEIAKNKRRTNARSNRSSL